MSSDIAIRVKNLGKMYRIGGPQARYNTFRETLTDVFAAPFRRAGRLLRGQGSAADLDQTIWALKDVSFEVKRGEVVGIIGRNGAGKSTLLKILSRITEPTEGSADIYGRVGSLLEVGTGFHPELTGRENTYLNGAILGMRRTEIDRKLDEIVAFAEIETFLDTPVKHYSSGMYVRLAFAVAAHLESDVLLIDEVLAVGDAGFQRKCLGKIEDVKSQGKCVLFVSHNMSAIANLCHKSILIDNGSIDGFDTTSIIVNRYLSELKQHNDADVRRHNGRRKGSEALISGVVLKVDGVRSTTVPAGGRFSLEVDISTIDHKISSPCLGLSIQDSLGNRVFATNMKNDVRTNDVFIDYPVFRVCCAVDALPLSPGSYSISLYFGNGTVDFDVIDNVLFFDVIWGNIYPNHLPPRASWGTIFLPISWRIGPVDSSR